jgi:hypothetical protein
MAIEDVLGRLTPRAADLIATRGSWTDHALLPGWERRLRDEGMPEADARAAEEFNRAWGGLHLPAGFESDGGPSALGFFDGLPGESFGQVGWWFECGAQRFSVPYAFAISPDGAFGLAEFRWVPLFCDFESWVESVALWLSLTEHATEVRVVEGSEVNEIDLTGTTAVAEIRGCAVKWMASADRVVVIDRGFSLLWGDRYAKAAVFEHHAVARDVGLTNWLSGSE